MNSLAPTSTQEKFDALAESTGAGIRTRACLPSLTIRFPVIGIDTHVIRMSRPLEKYMDRTREKVPETPGSRRNREMREAEGFVKKTRKAKKSGQVDTVDIHLLRYLMTRLHQRKLKSQVTK